MDHHTTLLLTRDDTAALMCPADYRRAVEAAFRARAEGLGAAPPPMHVAAEGGGFHVKGAGFPPGSLAGDRGYVAFKVNGNFPDNRAHHGLPTIQGAIVLCDGATGQVLALMDSIEITLQRTAAATAIAATHLARPDASRIAICGCGDQALHQLAALRDVLPLTKGWAWDADPSRARRLAAAAGDLGLPMMAVERLADAALPCEVVVTCTTARAPFLGPEHVAPGAFIAAVGADSPGKSEIQPALMAHATVVADSLSQALEMGDLRHAVAAGIVAPADGYAELGEVVTGRRVGRTRADEITLFDSTGMAIQDVAAAAAIVEIAIARDLGLAIRLNDAARPGGGELRAAGR